MPASSISLQAGAVILGGFEGTTLPPSFAKALSSGARGGAILFRRNILGDLESLVRLTTEIWACSPTPPLLGIDQEGGRVARLGPPFLRVPAALRLAEMDLSSDGNLIERVAECQTRELAALGLTMNFAPVFDVHSQESNPIIGDRAFGRSPDAATRGALAYARGVVRGGLLPCAKHFPGHGDTLTDSHEELPFVNAPLERLFAVELPPFAAAARAGIPFMMTAHVVYSAIDTLPATISPAIATELLRSRLRFRGALLSDDLEMRALASHYTIEEAAVLAIAAGCDGLLICKSEELQELAHAALVREATSSPAFRARIEDASLRMQAAKAQLAHRQPPSLATALSALGSSESTRVAKELSERGAQ